MSILPMLGAGVVGGLAGARGGGENKGRNFLKGFVNALPAAVGGLLGNKVIGGLPGTALGTVIGGALATPEAQEARKDQSGFFPELGLSEGLGAIWGAGADARKDQSGFLPELGLSEMGGKILGTDRTNKWSEQNKNTGKAAGSAGVKALPGAAALGEKAYGASASDRANNFLGLYDDWTSSTSNSPAAQSGAFSDSERFGQQMKHQQWLKDNNRKYDSRFESYLR